PVVGGARYRGIGGRATGLFRMHGVMSAEPASPAAAGGGTFGSVRNAAMEQAKNPPSSRVLRPAAYARGDAAEGPAVPIHSRALSSVRECVGGRKHLVEVVPHHGVAFAGD